MIDYIHKRMKKDVLEARVVRGRFDGTDHNAVVTKMQIGGWWEYGKK